MRGAFEMQLANGFTIRAMLSGRMMRQKIRGTVGRNVRSSRANTLNSVENDRLRHGRRIAAAMHNATVSDTLIY
jgi:hypothetical protein